MIKDVYCHTPRETQQLVASGDSERFEEAIEACQAAGKVYDELPWVFRGRLISARQLLDLAPRNEELGMELEVWIPEPDQGRVTDQVREGLSLAAAARAALVDSVFGRDVIAMSRAEAGMSADPGDTFGQYVTSVDIVDAVIVITYGNEADPEI